MADFDREWLGNVPRPGYGFDDGAQIGLRRLEERGNGDLGDVWLWSNRIAAALPQLREQLSGIPFVSRIAAGFIEELDGAFGVIVYAEVPDNEGFVQDPDDVGRSRFSMSVDDVSLPVVVRYTVLEEHWRTAPHVTAPTQARASCWVKSHSRHREGWLVPRHAVDPISARVAFDDGGTGRVIDAYGGCIDAVVVSSTMPPPARAPSRASWPVVAGQPLVLSASRGHHINVTVVDTDMNLGVLGSILFPVRFSIDWTGLPGDSGAFIVDDTLREPAGMYLGVLRPILEGYVPPGLQSAPPATGYAQTCHQLETASGLEFYP
ncbi:hypothetical protein [Leekyejoonella antrihumi]|uniref:Uncharacterized protein n=1 Tax=Leekyejoonella antrihumi TaxID=1660198 RepID=A0A563E1J3_9MICO|nr:hypothetical protein [Leekyejoonella antrihumi]TWP36103.1 hypothetical protein FGL98_11690 [Leekyejoonella antrihumi]